MLVEIQVQGVLVVFVVQPPLRVYLLLSISGDVLSFLLVFLMERRGEVCVKLVIVGEIAHVAQCQGVAIRFPWRVIASLLFLILLPIEVVTQGLICPHLFIVGHGIIVDKAEAGAAMVVESRQGIVAIYGVKRISQVQRNIPSLKGSLRDNVDDRARPGQSVLGGRILIDIHL